MALVNPDHVATDELIESEWGNAVADRVVGYYATKAAWDAALHVTGQTYVIADEFYIWNGSRLIGQRARYTPGIAVTANNAFGLVVCANVPLPLDYADRQWMFVCTLNGSGHAANGNVRMRIRNAGGADLGITGSDFYLSGQPFASVFTFAISKSANTAAETLSLWVEITGTGANTNIGGNVTPVMGYPS